MINKIDLIELGRAYLGAVLISIDGFLGWHVTNYVIYIISGEWMF